MPNFEALGVPNSKWQTWTHTQTDGRTDGQTPHHPIVKDFFETFTKIITNVAEYYYISKMDKQQAVKVKVSKGLS